MKTKTVFLCIFCFFSSTMLLFPFDQKNTLEKIIASLSSEKGMINAKKAYNSALLDQRYHYLQWWKPSLILNNDLIYPYERSEFDDLATSDTTNLVFSLPLHTGTIIDFSTGYGINRSIIELKKYGFTQNFQGKIGVGQSLNSWWLHTLKNPYKSGAVLQAEMAKTDYNIEMKNILFSCMQTYIAIRKTERNIEILDEKIALYDDMILSYSHNLRNGSISVREFQNIRKEKWEYEQTLFDLEQNITNLRNDLFEMTGVRIDTINNEGLIAVNEESLITVFLGINKQDIMQLEQTNIELQRMGLSIERLITRQANAPSIKIEFGTNYLLPVQETDKLNEAWKKKHFTDNELNSWSIGVSFNLSSLLSPINKKHRLEQRLTENMLNLLSQRYYEEKEMNRMQNNAIISLLETHINQLVAIVSNEKILSDEYKVLHENGGLNELDYRQIYIGYKEKNALLNNFYDDLWMYHIYNEYY